MAPRKATAKVHPALQSITNAAPKGKANQVSNSKKRKAPTDALDSASVHKTRVIDAAKKKIVKVALNDAPVDPCTVLLFGSGEGGELGFSNRGKLEQSVPKHNPILDGVVQMSAGGMHCIAITASNEILTWGVNDKGALGRDTTYSAPMHDLDDNASTSTEDAADLNPLESTPTAVSMEYFEKDTKFVQVEAGDSTSFALTATGLVYGWGIFRNTSGDLGFNITSKGKSTRIADQRIDPTPQSRPKLLAHLKNIVQIAAGGDHFIALDKSGSVFAFGAGEQGQLGRITGSKRYPHLSLIPSRVALPKKIVSVSAGANHSFAITDKGDAWTWGMNNYGQCSIPHNAGSDHAVIVKPERVKNMPGPMYMITGGNHHSIGVTKIGTCFTWGRLDSLATGHKVSALPLGNEDIVRKSDSGRPSILLEPTKLESLGKIAYVAAGSDHCLAVTEKGEVFSWGFNASQQLGLGKDSVEDEEGSDAGDRDIDEVEEPMQIKSKAVNGKFVVWAGCGGQFSAIAASV